VLNIFRRLFRPTSRNVLCSEELVELERLQSDIMKEVDTFQSLLSHRITLTSSDLDSSRDLEPPRDLGSLGVMYQVSCWFEFVVFG